MQCNKILKMTTTRSSVSCVIFGPPCQLPGNMLPTYEDTLKYYNLVKFQLKEASNGKDPSHSEISSKVTAEIEALWEKASLPVVSLDRVRAMLKTYHQKYQNCLKPYQTRKEKDSYKAKLLAFKLEAMKLFDICTCKCSGEFCKCSKSRKIPAKEIAFLHDQRGVRKMILGRIDAVQTAVLQKRLQRNEALKRRYTSPSCSSGGTSSQPFIAAANDDIIDTNNCDMGSYESTCFCDDEWQGESNTIQKKKRIRVALPTLAAASDRHGVSDRAAATLATAVLQDMQIVHQGDTTQVIDRSKVRRERHKKRGDQAMESNTTFCGLYFDVKKDRTIIQNKMDDGKFHRQTIMEEHVSIVLEPGSSYFTHVSPTNGASESIARAILKCLETKSVDMV